MSHETETQATHAGDAPRRRGWLDFALGGGLFSLALCVYIATLSAGAYPGESARLVVDVLGLFPRILPAHPLWTGLARGVAALPLGQVATRLNLVSALCGAGAIWLLYDLVRVTLQRLVDPYSLNASRVPMISRVAAVAAALFLAFSVPFWMVSTRAHPAAFDLLLLLALVRLFVYWTHARRLGSSCALLFAAAVLCVEFATAWLVLPVLCLVLPILLWRKQELRPVALTAMALSVAAGLALYLVTAWLFLDTEGYVLRGYTGYFHVLRQMLRQQYMVLAHGLPKEGWLIVLFTTVVPWMTALVVARRGLNTERDWSYYLLHIIMTTLVLLVLLNVRIAPWPLMRSQAELGRLLVTPYLLSASLFGYLVAYWFLLPLGWWERGEQCVAQWFRRWLGALWVAPLVVLVGVMPFWNAAPASGKPARFVNAYAREMLDALDGREWLVTDGSVDHHLLIAAWDRDRPLTLISLPSSRNELYMRYVASRFESPRMKNLAEIGLLPLLQEWMSTEPRIGEQLAIQALPDVWVGAGYTPVPARTLFLGVKDEAAVEVAQRRQAHAAFWERMVPLLKDTRMESDSLERLRQHLLRHTSLVANNLGVLLEDHGDREAAFEVYARAREMDPDNVSALLNQLAIVDDGLMPEHSAAVRQDSRSLMDKLEAQKQKYRIWSLARHHGYVRLPHAFSQLGWTWAFSGRPSLAVAGFKRAMDLLPAGERSGMRKALARLYLSAGEEGAGEEIYRDLLEKDPENLDALFGMGRVELARDRPDEALTYLRRAREAGADRRQLALELATVLAASGNVERARILLDELIELTPGDARVWSLMVAILVQEKDRDGLAASIQRMQQAGADRSVVAALARAHLALLENNFSRARSHFERILSMQPNHLHALQTILGLDVQQGREADAARHAKRLLTLDPDNALAHRIKGSLQLKEGNLALAEDSLRRALQARRSPLILNDLAWVLQERGAYEEAEALARESVAMEENLASALDTLGVVLMNTERLAEARDALEKALRFARGNPAVHLHLAQVYDRLGDEAGLKRMLDLLAEQTRYLNAEQQRTLETVRERNENDD